MISIKQGPLTSVSLLHYQAAINAMNLEQQLSQYAFFNQQSPSQNQQRQQVSFVSCKQQEEQWIYMMNSQWYINMGKVNMNLDIAR